MGSALVNHWATSTLGWVIAAFILAVNAADVWEFAQNEISGTTWLLLVLLAVAAYLVFVLYLTIGPERYSCSIHQPEI